MKKFLLVALMALCGASFGFGDTSAACYYDCMKVKQNKKECYEDCYKKARVQQEEPKIMTNKHR